MHRIRLFACALPAAAMILQAQDVQLGEAPRVDWSTVKSQSSARLLGPASVAGWIDTSNRAAVIASWTTGMNATDNIPMGWTGQVSGCAAGDVSAAWRTAVFDRINWFRGMAGVPAGIGANPTWSGQNQQAALMMSANQTLNHFPPTSWACYTASGAEAAGKSNICYLLGFGSSDPGCVAAYVSDTGNNNLAVGHRRWVLFPQSTTMGVGEVNQTGSFGRANATWVVDSSAMAAARPATRDNFVAWPPKGYVPYQAVYARWSISYPGANFAGAAVTMSRNGSAVSSTLLPIQNGFGENTLVWEPSVNLGVAGADTNVDVTVSNVVVGGVSQTFQYRVIIIDPGFVQAPNTVSVTVNSSPAGRTVTVDGSNYLAPHTFQWTPGASHTMSVPSPQTISDTEQALFQNWNFSSTNSQTVSPSANTTYTISFGSSYKLSRAVSPLGAGAVTATPASANGFYAAGSQVTVVADAIPPYVFSNWAGDATGSNSQVAVVMSKPITATAVFVGGSTGSPTGGLHFVPITPCRVADTRNATGPFGGPFIGGGATRSFLIPQSNCGVPSTVRAYSLNLTVVPSGALGYVSIWPTGQSQPLVSTLNAPDGQITANAAIVPAGISGGIEVFVTNNAQLVMDINGYFDLPRTGASAFYPVTPCRVTDTRNPAGALGGPALAASVGRSFPIRQSSCGIPASATAYVLNVTVVPSGPLGYITTWPTGQPQPLVSTTNAPTGQITANMAIVPAGTNGEISFFGSNSTHLVADVMGYFGAPDQPGALKLYPVTPCRLVDTRNPAAALGGPVLAAGAGRSFPLTASPCGLPPQVQGYSANFTVVPSGPLGYLTTWPTGVAQPLVSTLNAADGQITANAAIVPAGSGAAISVFVTNPAQVIIDTNGYFAP